MAIVLSGKVLTNAGAAVAGATIKVYATTDLVNAVDNTTSDASGLWSITGLAAASYAVEVESNGKYRWYWPNAVQLANLTVGEETVVLKSTGDVDLITPTTPAEGGDEDSPVLMIYGAYDSDPIPADANVTKANYGLGLQSVVTNTAGTPSAILRVVDNAKAATGVAFGEDGTLTAGAITCETITVTGGGGAGIAVYHAYAPLLNSYAPAQGDVPIYDQEVVIGATSLVTVTAQLTWGGATGVPGNFDVQLFYTKDAGAEVAFGHAEIYSTTIAYYFCQNLTRHLSLEAGTYRFIVKSKAHTAGKNAWLMHTDDWDCFLDVVVQPA